MKSGALIICLTMVVFAITGCAEIVSEKPIDIDYIAAYDSIEMDYEYKYDWYHSDYVYLPVYKSVHHEAVYKVQYEVAYSDGRTIEEWRVVNRAEYEAALNEMKGGEGQ